jgi:hypothetical protein
MVAIMTGPLIVPMMMIGQAVLTTIFTQTRLIVISRETYTIIYATMTMMIGQAFLTTIGAVLTGMIGLQVGLMIGEVVRGIAGAVPIRIAKFGL